MEEKKSQTNEKQHRRRGRGRGVVYTNYNFLYALPEYITRGTRCAPVYVRGDVFNFVARNIRVVRVRYHNTGVRATIPRAAEQPRSAGVNEEGQTVEDEKVEPGRQEASTMRERE